MQQNFVSKLSGGEKRRLHLLTVLLRNPNFLILDEPTNDLDLLTLATLEEFLLHFNGCLLLVSHDRYFMDKLVDHLFVFEGDGIIRDFNGTYSEYRDDLDERVSQQKKENIKSKTIEEVPANTIAKKKLSFKEKQEMEKLEKEMPMLEAEKSQLMEQMSDGTAGHEKLQQLASRLDQIIQELDEKGLRWLELAEING
jgi:ATP-binding cassette subfamily F protein uup